MSEVELLVQLSKLLCKDCTEWNYKKCLSCLAYKLVNVLLEKHS
jgi:hypothetical protein